MRKVLIIAYYWPPAGGPGVQRWLKFVKYLPEFGIEPVVYVPENPQYPIKDENLLKQVPAGATVIRKKIFEPSRVFSLFAKKEVRSISSGIIPEERTQSMKERLLLWIRGNLFIPDARVFWVRPSVRYLRRYIHQNGIDTVITTGPPHSLHLIGLKLKEKSGVKWIADFRDPWTTIGYHKSLKLSAFAENRHEKLESKVMTSADHLLVTSHQTKNDFSRLTNRPISVITNGYDIERKPELTLDEKFTISHIGSLLSKRNPQVLWQALSELVRESAFADDFRLQLIGTVSQEVIESIKMYGLDTYTDIMGYMSHEEAVIHQQKTQVLLLVEINSPETKSIIAGKLFEYMVSGRPVLAIGPSGAEIASVIADTEIGVFADYSDKQLIMDTIRSYYQEYLNGRLEVNAGDISGYSRRSLTGKLSNVIRELWES